MQYIMASFIVDDNDVIIVDMLTKKPYYSGNILRTSIHTAIKFVMQIKLWLYVDKI